MYINPEKIANARVASQSHPNRTYKNNACFTAKKNIYIALNVGGNVSTVCRRERKKKITARKINHLKRYARIMCVCVCCKTCEHL